MKRILLLAIAIALMSIGSASAQRVRVNNFTPLGIRPDVVVRGGGHNNDVFINGFNNGGTVFINGFGSRGNHRSTVFVSPTIVGPAFVPPAQVFFSSSSPVIVDPTRIYGFNPLGSPGYGYVNPFGNPFGGSGYGCYSGW